MSRWDILIFLALIFCAGAPVTLALAAWLSR
jgi:hypothetical protein